MKRKVINLLITMTLFIAVLYIWNLTNIKFQYFNLEYSFKKILLLKSIAFLFVLGIIYSFLNLSKIYFVSLWTICLCFVFTIIFYNNNHFINFHGDYWYMNAIVSKYKYYNGWLLDTTIKDIPSYLAPLYFFIIGNIAKLFNIPSYTALLLGSCVGVFITPYLVYYLLKNRFSDIVICISVLVIPVFFHYEVAMKPYQTVAALLSLIFYYKIICNENKFTLKKYLISIVFGITLFLLYYYSFVYLAIAFFVERVFNFYQNKTLIDSKTIKNSIIYFVIAAAGCALFILPHIIAIQNSGSSNSIFYLATSNLFWPLFDLIIIIGLIQILKTIETKESQDTIIIFLSVSLIYVLNFYSELIIGGDLSVLKVIHVFSLIVIPFSIDFILGLINFQKNKIINVKLGYCIIIFLVGIYSTNKWIEQFIETKVESYHADKVKFIERFQNKYELKNKVIFNTYFHDAVEIGALTPAYLFTPVNIDYASPASRIKERIEFVKSFKDCINPAKFALNIYANSIQKIDYIYWNDKNIFAMPNQYRMGENSTMNEFGLNQSILSTKYINKPKFEYQIYELNYSNDFKNKNSKECTFLENLALDRIKSNHFQELMNDLMKNASKYQNSDLEDTKNYLINSKLYTDAEMNVFIKFIKDSVAKYPQLSFRYEAEKMPTLINDSTLNQANVRKVTQSTNTSQSNVVIFGPYCSLPKGNYKANFKVKSNSNIPIKKLSLDVFVENKDISRTFYLDNNITKSLNKDNFEIISIFFSVKSNSDIIQTRCYYTGGYELEIDYIDIIPI